MNLEGMTILDLLKLRQQIESDPANRGRVGSGKMFNADTRHKQRQISKAIAALATKPRDQ
jgi:hypothetical protein